VQLVSFLSGVGAISEEFENWGADYIRTKCSITLMDNYFFVLPLCRVKLKA
jgi:hypothetical protein